MSMWTKAKPTLPPLPRAIPIHFPDQESSGARGENVGCFLTSHWPLRSLSTVGEQSPGRAHLPWGYSSLCACWKTCMQCDQCHKACQWQYTNLMVPRVHHDVHCFWWPFEVDPNNIAEMQSQNWRLREFMSQRPFENEVEEDSDLTGLFGSLLSRQVSVHN